MSRVIFVSGPQGSGTSAVAGALNLLGINMGERLKEPSPLNPKGHYECLDFEEIIKPILEEESIEIKKEKFQDIASKIKDYVYKRNLISKDIWGIKLPILAYFIKYMIPHIDECMMISVDRPFDGCVKSSMLKYPGMDRKYIEFMHNDIRKSRLDVIDRYDIKNINIDFNDLTENSSKVIKDITDFCFYGLVYPSQSSINEAISFIDPSLNHRREL